jgi:hypothetical protein
MLGRIFQKLTFDNVVEFNLCLLTFSMSMTMIQLVRVMETAISEARQQDRPVYNAKKLADEDLNSLLDHVKAEKAWRDLVRKNQA